jgi:hypothetical protein
VKEKLLVNRYNERLDVSCCEKRTNQRCGSCCRTRADVRRLANLARGFILPFFMRVPQGLRTEHDKQNRQGKRQHSDPGILRFVLAVHFDTYTIPGSSFDASSVPR